MSTLGWDGKTADTTPDAGFRTQRKGNWTELAGTFNLPLDEHFLESTKALKEKARQRRDLQAVIPDRQSSISTRGLYVILGSYVHSRGKLHQRDLARKALQ
eukprot:760123-Amphidinium_carterae.1